MHSDTISQNNSRLIMYCNFFPKSIVLCAENRLSLRGETTVLRETEQAGVLQSLKLSKDKELQKKKLCIHSSVWLMLPWENE